MKRIMKHIVFILLAVMLAAAVCTALAEEPALPEDPAAEGAPAASAESADPPIDPASADPANPEAAAEPAGPASDPAMPGDTPAAEPAPADPAAGGETTVPEDPAEKTDPDESGDPPADPAEGPAPADPAAGGETTLPEDPAEKIDPDESGDPPADPAEEPAGEPDPAAPADPSDPDSVPDDPEEKPGEGEIPAEQPDGTNTEDPAEEPPAAPDSDTPDYSAPCPHEHTKTVYYFDAPGYRPLNDECHLVLGSATVEETCLDCGAELSIEVISDAEEVQPHVFRNGYCVLCGREQAVQATPAVSRESVVELTAGDEPDQFFLTLTGKDLEEAGDTLVLRPEGRDAALAVQTNLLREEIDRSGGTFTAEIWRPGDRNVSASLRLYDASGEVFLPEGQGISLRIYTENRDTPLTVSFTDLNGATSSEEARWIKNSSGEGYWIVTWLGDGLYQFQ